VALGDEMSNEDQLSKLEEAVRDLGSTVKDHLASAQVSVLEATFTEFKNSTFPEFKNTMTTNFASLSATISDNKKNMYWFAGYGIAAIASLWLGIAYLNYQVHSVDTKVSMIDGTLTAIKEVVISLKPSRDVGSLPLAVPVAPVPVPVPVLDEGQKDLVQKELPESGFKIWPAADKLTVGELVNSPNVLAAVPNDVGRAIPAFAGALYTVGKISILFVSRDKFRIFAIVPRRG
jgi:hypothetical protein